MTVAENTALLETMLYTPAVGYRHLHHHLARLSSSATTFGYRYDKYIVRRELGLATLRILVPSRVRIMVERSGHVVVENSPIGCSPRSVTQLVIDDERVCSTDIDLRHKTTDRRRYDRRRRRFPTAGDIVMVNEHSSITETTVANIAIRSHGHWWTPPVKAGCLPGIERAHQIAIGMLREREIDIDELRTADRVVLMSSLRGVRDAVLDLDIQQPPQPVSVDPGSNLH